MNKKRILRCILFAALMIGLVPAAMMAAEGDIVMNGTQTGGTVVVNSETNTITVTGDVTLTGTGDAFTIGADTNLVFADGASLTLSGYTNGFVIENAKVTSSNMDIVAQSLMDVFRLKTNGKLDLSGANSIYGSGKEGTTNRAVVLPGSTSGQEVMLEEGASLAANNFYRAIETGGAANYTISGAVSGLEENADSNTVSTFDFSDNDCGMALSYFDSNVRFEDCVLEVSNCLTSGIFMRQDNASLNGLTIDNVYINCVNDPDKLGDGQNDIAIRFHTVDFSIINSKINIENAWNTGLWIFDGWDKSGTKEIKDTIITVKNVGESPNASIVASSSRKKAITFVPYGTWTIEGCEFTMEGTADNEMQCGLNVGNDTQISTSSGIKAKPSMYGGTLNISDSSFETNYLEYMDIGVQVGQFVNIGADVVIDNDYVDSASRDNEHYTILCDTIEGKYPVTVLGLPLRIDYDYQNMAAEYQVPDRVTVSGGSYFSSLNKGLNVLGYSGEELFESSIPVNVDGEKLTMFTITPAKYSDYMSNGIIDILRNDGTSEYQYQATKASADGNRYIWAPAATVTFVDSENNTLKTEVVPRGAAFGLVAELPADYDCGDFTEATEVTGDMTVEVQ